jgi:uncharacterized membrane protein YoaK (UPF0700 family)
MSGERAIGANDGLRDSLLIGLTFAAGLVDAVSYLGLGQIFTANMTGNLIFLALAVGQGSLNLALRSIDALLFFSCGAVLAGRLLGPSKGPGLWSSQVTWVFGCEAVFAAVFAAGWVVLAGKPSGTPLYVLIGLSSAGMGMQNAAARHLAIPGLTTTVITTALTGLMAQLAALNVSGPESHRWVTAITALFSGAAIGGALMLYERSWPPIITVAILLVVCGLAFTYAGPRVRSTPTL